ncbi:hypothetical protein [Rhodococcus sp. IC4_135]
MNQISKDASLAHGVGTLALRNLELGDTPIGLDIKRPAGVVAGAE